MDRNAEVKIVTVGGLFTNCYLVGYPGGRAFIVDPGDEPKKIEKEINKNKFSPVFIINTHGHIDHIKADAYFGLPVYIHKDDAPLLRDSELNLSSFLGFSFVLDSKTEVSELEDKDVVDFSGERIEVIHTPGHTLGGICLKFQKSLFSGDTLFHRSVGRTDIKGGDHSLLIKSIKERLFCLDENLMVFPGHGPKTLLSEEKRMNPFLI